MQSLPANRQRTLEAVAARVVPESATLAGARRDRFLAIIDDALAQRAPGMRRQLGSFLALIHLAPVVRFGRSFESLPGERQDSVLRWLEGGPVSLLRKGFWGLKVLVFMGYYGQPETWPEIGYAPEFDGNARLHV